MSKDIEHTTAEELLALVHSQLFTMSDAVICADALLVVVKLKHLRDKAERANLQDVECLYAEALEID